MYKGSKTRHDSEMRFESNLNTILNYNITEEQINISEKISFVFKKVFHFLKQSNTLI